MQWSSSYPNLWTFVIVVCSYSLLLLWVVGYPRPWNSNGVELWLLSSQLFRDSIVFDVLTCAFFVSSVLSVTSLRLNRCPKHPLVFLLFFLVGGDRWFSLDAHAQLCEFLISSRSDNIGIPQENISIDWRPLLVTWFCFTWFFIGRYLVLSH